MDQSLLDTLRVVALPTKTNFRGINLREVALFKGEYGWAEFSPFLEYEFASLNKSVCLVFKYIVYIINNKAIIFITSEVLKKLLNGLITKRTIIIMDVAEHIHMFLVESVNIVKLNGALLSI